MKKSFWIIQVATYVIFSFVFLIHSQVYAAFQFTDDYYKNTNPKINNKEDIVWAAEDGNNLKWAVLSKSSDRWIFYNLEPRSFDARNPSMSVRPEINDIGHVVFQGYDGNDWEIFFYDEHINGIQLTNNSYDDRNPQINNDGHVVWEGFDGHDFEIFLYEGTLPARQLTSNSYDDLNPQINDFGNVVWEGDDYWIFHYDGTRTAQYFYYNPGHNPQINNVGQIVWEAGQYQGCIILRDVTGENYCIHTYNGSDVWNVRINDDGHVVWEGYEDGIPGIFLYDGTTSKTIANNTFVQGYPQINDDGNVVWSGDNGNGSMIFLYDGKTTKQLSDYPSDWRPQINDNGHVVWQGKHEGDNDYEIFWYEPPSGDDSGGGGGGGGG